MKIYLTWYYGYKNFGDELLLFGVIQHLYNKHACSLLYIEAQDPRRLCKRLETNKQLLPDRLKVCAVGKRSNFFLRRDLTVFGWWELVSDARAFPFNWRNYLFWFFWTILFGRYELLWWIGTIRYKTTHRLYKLFLAKAESITVRESASFALAKKYNHNTIQHQDFAYDVVWRLVQKNPLQKDDILLINCNPYLWWPAIQEKIHTYRADHPEAKSIYFPAAMGVDEEFSKKLDTTVDEVYDWTQHSLKDTLTLFANARYAIGTRLHFLILTDYYGVSYEPLVYQEKITKVLNISK